MTDDDVDMLADPGSLPILLITCAVENGTFVRESVIVLVIRSIFSAAVDAWDLQCSMILNSP